MTSNSTLTVENSIRRSSRDIIELNLCLKGLARIPAYSKVAVPANSNKDGSSTSSPVQDDKAYHARATP